MSDDEIKVDVVPVTGGIVDMELFETVCFERDAAEKTVQLVREVLRDGKWMEETLIQIDALVNPSD